MVSVLQRTRSTDIALCVCLFACTYLCACVHICIGTVLWCTIEFEGHLRVLGSLLSCGFGRFNSVKCLYLLSHLAALPTLSLYWAVVLWHCTCQANAHPLACIPSPLRRSKGSGPLLAGFGVGCLFGTQTHCVALATLELLPLLLQYCD